MAGHRARHVLFAAFCAALLLTATGFGRSVPTSIDLRAASSSQLNCYAPARTIASTQPVAIAWKSPSDADERRSLADWCHAVGPAVVAASPARHSPTPVSGDSVVVATWNVHVGGADLPGFIAALQRGDFTNGAPVQHFVVLLQEAYRSGADVPDVTSHDAGVASRIDPDPPAGVRRDIVSIASDLGLEVFYAPSMRNGSETGPRAEDRGNAILSTLPLSNFRAIELPFERQRRVAISATVEGISLAGESPLVVSSAHLDATGGLKRLRVFATGLRARQARALASALGAETGAMVMGTDLNTWWDGPNEPAYRTLEKLFVSTPLDTFATHAGGTTLDYLLFRLPSNWRAGVRPAASRFGSDHTPLIGRIERSQ